MKTTWLVWSHIPIIFPSGEQTSWPGDVQEAVPAMVAVDPEEPASPAAGAAEAAVEPVGAEVGISVAKMVATVEAAAVLVICTVGAGPKTLPTLDWAAKRALLEAAGAALPPAELPEDPPATSGQFGMRRTLSSTSTTSEEPGCGNLTHVFATVAHPLPILAVNMGGKDGARLETSDSSAASISGMSRLPEPPVTVTGAQFMYISRWPILLNHVHAKT